MKVVTHSMTHQDWLGVLGIDQYEQRCLISTPDDDVIVLSRAPGKEVLAYREQYLGFSPARIILAAGGGRHLCERMLNDGSLHQRLRDAVGHDEELIMDPFGVTLAEEQVARMFHLRLDGSAEITHEVGSKSGLRHIANLAGVPVVRGYQYLRSQDLPIAVDALFAEYPDIEEVVIKGDWGVSGTQQLRLQRHDGRSVRPRLDAYVRQVGFTRGVVEAWKPEVLTSVGVHYLCNGAIQSLRGPWQQYLVNKTEYAGTMYPALSSATFIARMRDQGLRLAAQYHAIGYRGHLGFDVIELPDGSCRWVDCNARKGGVYFPQRFAELRGATDKAIVARDLQHVNIRLMSFTKLLDQVRPDLFSVKRSDRNGIVFYNTGMMQYGKIQVVCLGENLEQCEEYLRIIQYALDRVWL